MARSPPATSTLPDTCSSALRSRRASRTSACSRPMKASSPACAPGTAARPASGRRWLRGCREAAAGADPFQIVLHGQFAQLRGHWAWIEAQTRTLSAPTVKQRLAAIRHLFDWLVTGQVVPVNPAASVRGPRHIVREGKTPVLGADEARQLLDSIDVSTAIGLRDRALIGLMAYSFARIGAASDMKVEDVYTQNRRLWVRLREKGGKAHAMPCHHNLEEYLTA